MIPAISENRSHIVSTVERQGDLHGRSVVQFDASYVNRQKFMSGCTCISNLIATIQTVAICMFLLMIFLASQGTTFAPGAVNLLIGCVAAICVTSILRICI
jgi:hypothetical protein